jgi:hypothetical protein
MNVTLLFGRIRTKRQMYRSGGVFSKEFLLIAKGMGRFALGIALLTGFFWNTNVEAANNPLSTVGNV